MARRVTFGVYGRFRVAAEETSDGVWVLYRLGSDGKRSRVTDAVIPDDATLEDVERGIEAAYHELGRPGTSITRVDTRSP